MTQNFLCYFNFKNINFDQICCRCEGQHGGDDIPVPADVPQHTASTQLHIPPPQPTSPPTAHLTPTPLPHAQAPLQRGLLRGRGTPQAQSPAGTPQQHQRSLAAPPDSVTNDTFTLQQVNN